VPERHVVNVAAGQQGFEEAVAEVLSDVHPGDVIVVPDAESEKRVREAAGKFGFGVDEEGGDLGIGFEIAPTMEEVEFDQTILEYMVQGEDEASIKAEVYDKLSEPDFDPETIFVVANRKELLWVFEAVSRRREDLALSRDARGEDADNVPELGDVRATVAMSNVIVTSAEDFPAPPKLEVKIDAENLAEGIKQSLKDAGFAIGYRERVGVLAVRGGSDVVTEVGLLVEGEPGEDSEFFSIGKAGETVKVALPLPPGEGPNLKLTAAKPEADSPKVEATPEHGTDAPESGEPSVAEPTPDRTERKNVVDG